MSAKYHINPKTGRSNSCGAKPGGCPFGGDGEHYPSREDAQIVYEASMANKAVPTSKSKDFAPVVSKLSSFKINGEDDPEALSNATDAFAEGCKTYRADNDSLQKTEKYNAKIKRVKKAIHELKQKVKSTSPSYPGDPNSRYFFLENRKYQENLKDIEEKLKNMRSGSGRPTKNEVTASERSKKMKPALQKMSSELIENPNTSTKSLQKLVNEEGLNGVNPTFEESSILKLLDHPNISDKIRVDFSNNYFKNKFSE